jgi:hypothetical protein
MFKKAGWGGQKGTQSEANTLQGGKYKSEKYQVPLQEHMGRSGYILTFFAIGEYELD